jgi:hypothetical protein
MVFGIGDFRFQISKGGTGPTTGIASFRRQLQKSGMAAKERRDRKEMPYSPGLCVLCILLRLVLQSALRFQISKGGVAGGGEEDGELVVGEPDVGGGVDAGEEREVRVVPLGAWRLAFWRRSAIT